MLWCLARLLGGLQLVQLQQLERVRRGRDDKAAGAALLERAAARAAEEARAASGAGAGNSTAATAAVQQLHEQLLTLNVSAQVKMQRARQPHRRKIRPANSGTTDRNLWPTHKRFGVPPPLPAGAAPADVAAAAVAAAAAAASTRGHGQMRSQLSVASRSSVNSGWRAGGAARPAAVGPRGSAQQRHLRSAVGAQRHGRPGSAAASRALIGPGRDRREKPTGL